jgi:hypothetical protein
MVLFDVDIYHQKLFDAVQGKILRFKREGEGRQALTDQSLFC